VLVARAASRSLLSSLMCSVVALAYSCQNLWHSSQTGLLKVEIFFLFHGREKRRRRLGGGTLTSLSPIADPGC
jgi:hypothetical protein